MRGVQLPHLIIAAAGRRAWQSRLGVSEWLAAQHMHKLQPGGGHGLGHAAGVHSMACSSIGGSGLAATSPATLAPDLHPCPPHLRQRLEQLRQVAAHVCVGTVPHMHVRHLWRRGRGVCTCSRPCRNPA